MKPQIRTVAIAFVSFCLILKAHAEGEATLTGTVKGASGQPIQGAEIRIQGRDADKIGRIHTDAGGHYSYPALESGTYNVTLIVDRAVKASINNVKTKAGETQTLNFDFLKGGTAKPLAKGRHYVWIPHQTGSHLGVWIEADDNAKEMPIGMQERIRWSGSALARQLQYNSTNYIPR
ncbi:MAG: hypothetical protein DME30_04045 [Verrucomicrobia bacterium]|nr:MAG: hypothetical protein DME30_04045 [Verrucomicrobiota bacterium]